MSSRRTNDIEALSEQLRSLQIMEEASSNYEQMNTEMSVALAPAPAPALAAISENVQAGIYYGMLWILIIFLFFYLISLILY